jgi:hypothetical protein
LSQTAAALAAVAAVDVACDQAAATRWMGRQWQYYPASGELSKAELMPRETCRWDHARRWRNPARISGGTNSIGLRDLFAEARVAVDLHARIRFCQRVALRGRCRDCQRNVGIVRWFADQGAVGQCADCGGPVYGIAFWTFEELSVEPLLAVLDRPLSEWGVEAGAVIEIARHDRRQAFIVG